MSKKEKKSFKERAKDLNKKINKVWLYTTIATVVVTIIAGVYLGVEQVMSDKREMVLKSLVDYNKTVLGYDATEKPYSEAFPYCGYRYNKSFIESIETLTKQCSDYTIYNYYDMLYLKIIDYTGKISDLDSMFDNESVAGWCVQNGLEYYYGSPNTPTTISTNWKTLNITSDSIDTLTASILNYVGVGQDILLVDDNYGVFFLSGTLDSHLGSNISNIDQTNMYLIIAGVMDAGWANGNSYDFMNSYNIIKEAYTSSMLNNN